MVWITRGDCHGEPPLVGKVTLVLCSTVGVNISMQLRSLSISHYRAIRQQDFCFTDAMGRIRPMTVLAGPNGSGKSSILFAIYRALSGAMGYHSDDVPEASDDEIFREGGAGGWSFQQNRVSISLELEYGREERETAPRLLEATRSLQKPRPDGKPTSVPDLPEGRLGITWQFPPDQYPNGTFNSIAFVRPSVPGGAT